MSEQTEVEDDSPSVIGPAPPLPTKEEKWMAAYVARMIARGIDIDDAWACARAGTNDYDDDPEACADDELEYWDNDEVR